MSGLVLMVIMAYVGLALVDLPPLMRRPDRRREFWAVTVLLLIGLCLAILVVRTDVEISAFKVIAAIFKPIGTALFKAKESR
jgi:Na+/melibiose symporter-like transporter